MFYFLSFIFFWYISDGLATEQVVTFRLRAMVLAEEGYWGKMQVCGQGRKTVETKNNGRQESKGGNKQERGT